MSTCKVLRNIHLKLYYFVLCNNCMVSMSTTGLKAAQEGLGAKGKMMLSRGWGEGDGVGCFL